MKAGRFTVAPPGEIEPIRLRVSRVVADETPTTMIYLDLPSWPPVTAIADWWLRATAADELDGPRITFRYPFLTIGLANGRATYRVETLERGVWRATLVEGERHDVGA